MNRPQRFLRACRAEPVDRVPVWLMRQAGRYLPEYRQLRTQYPFLTLCKTPELAVEVTLQPIERFGMDAAVLFSDILTLLEAMGVELRFEENVGPKLGRAETLQATVEGLHIPDPEDELGFVMETIRQLRPALEEKAALIGFSGAPFTLATYLIEGGTSRDFWATRCFMYQEPVMFHKLMDRLADAVLLYLKAQIHAGVQAVQLFDTWSGILSPADYREFVLPYLQRIFEELKGEDIPTIHFSLGASASLDLMKEAGAEVLSLDWKIDLKEARERLGPDQPVQGNMDPFALFQPPERLGPMVTGILEDGSRWPGYIFNLGHGIHRKTPLDNVYHLMELVKGFLLS